MPRIPDTMGAMPTPRASRQLPNEASVAQGYQRAADIQASNAGREGTGLVGIGEDAQKTAKEIAAVHAKILAREDAVAIANAVTDYRTQAHDEFLKLTAESDWSKPETGKGYFATLEQLPQQLFEKYPMSSDGQAKFYGLIDSHKATFKTNAISQGYEVGKNKVLARFADDMKQLSDTAYQDPGKVLSLLNEANERVKPFANVIDPMQEDTSRKAMHSAIAESAINSLLDRGGWQETMEFIDATDIDALLDAQSTRRLQSRISVLREAEKDAIKQSMIKAQEPIVVPAGAGLYSKSGGTALAKQPPAPSTSISIDQTSESSFEKFRGENEAKTLKSAQDDALAATQLKPTITQMKSAISSGAFKTGSLAVIRQTMTKFADLVGIKGEEISPLLGSAATADNIDTAANKLAVQIAQGEGRITNLFLKNIADSLPALAKTEQGNLILLDIMDRAATRQIQVAKIAENYSRKYKGMTPENQQSFVDKVAELEEKDPIITQELQDRIAAEVGTTGGVTATGIQETITKNVMGAKPTGTSPSGTLKVLGINPKTGNIIIQMPDGSRVEATAAP